MASTKTHGHSFNERRFRRNAGLLLPMTIALLGIIGFQAWWLRDNFAREKEALVIRTNVLFGETSRKLQDSLIETRFRIAIRDSVRHEVVRNAVATGPAGKEPDGGKGNGHLLRLISRALDTTSAGDKDTMVIFPDFRGTQGDQSILLDPNSASRVNSINIRKDRKSRVRRDSVQSISIITFDDQQGQKFTIRLDSVMNKRTPEPLLRADFDRVLRAQHLPVAFTLAEAYRDTVNADGTRRRDLVGDADGYKLNLGNVTAFLLKRISGTILFSILLVAITVFSFIILYRSLLRQFRLSAMKNELISNITHELKTPISTVGVAIEALRNFNALKDTQRTEEYLEISQMELQRLGLLVDKVLKLSMFENKRIDINMEWLRVDELISEVTSSLRLQLQKYQVTLHVQTSGELTIQGDRLHLLSVIFNLLDNALKYGRPMTNVYVSATGDEKELILSVRDEGLGIPAAYKDRVFDKFFRVPYGDTHNAKGHGLGLSYVAQVIKRHGGDIRVSSTEGVGTEFIVQLPKQQPTETT